MIPCQLPEKCDPIRMMLIGSRVEANKATPVAAGHFRQDQSLHHHNRKVLRD